MMNWSRYLLSNDSTLNKILTDFYGNHINNQENV